MIALLSTNSDWYLMRASGFVALALLTISLCLGIANLARLSGGPWTRTVAALVHRNVSLLAVVFLFIHVLTAISDKYVNIPALSILVPGLSGYDPVWIGLGAVSVDLMIAVVATSLLRGRLPQRAWQFVHWTAYLMFPTALVHSIFSGAGNGRDTGTGWSTAIYLACGLLFAVAAISRLRLRRRPGSAVPPVRYPLPVSSVEQRPVAPFASIVTSSHIPDGIRQ